MKVLVTGGAGFVGSNLIRYFLKKTNYKIISIDNYSSGYKSNHIENKNVKKVLKAVNPHEKNIFGILEAYPFTLLS